jgi:hypothetical protein
VSSPPQGVIPLPHIGQVGTVDRWAAALSEIAAITVYRRQTASVPNPPEWVVVDTSEYVLSETSWTADENPFGPYPMTHTYVDFLSLQPKGTEIRADIDGIFHRGAWGILPDLNTPGTALRNPIDFFIGLAYFASRKAGIPEDAFAVDEIAAVRSVFDTLGYVCDGAITEPITLRAFFGQFLASFNLDMYVNRHGQITLAFTHAEDPARPVWTEGKHIVRESFTESLPPEITNQVQYQLAYNNATRSFETTRTINLPDQEAAAIGTEPKVETEVLSQYFIRDEVTAEAMALQRNQWVAPGSFRQQFKIPAPLVFDSVEMAKQVGLTHSMGLDKGGYQNREVKITGMVLDLDKLEYTLSTILRVPMNVAGPGHGRMTMRVGLFTLTGFDVGPLPMGTGSFTLTGEAVTFGAPLRAPACGVVDFTWKANSLVGPFWRSVAPGTFFLVGVHDADNTQMRVFSSTNNGENWTAADDTFPALTNNIASFESRYDGDHSILIVTQEAVTGRVAYSRFDLDTSTWIVKNAQVAATGGVPSGTSGWFVSDFLVSIDRRDNGDVVVFYQTSETVSGSAYGRGAYRLSSDDGSTWTSEVKIGEVGVINHNIVSRVVRGKSSAAHFIFQSSAVPIYTQTLNGSNSLGSLVNQASHSDMLWSGRPVAYVTGADHKVVVPWSWFGALVIATFSDDGSALTADSMTTQPNETPNVCEALVDCNYPMATMDYVDGQQNVVAQLGTGVGGNTWAFYQGGGPGSWTGSVANSRIGPMNPGGGRFGTQHCNGLVFTHSAILYAAAIIGHSSTVNMFQLEKISDLPSIDRDDTAWLAACTH